MLKVDAVNCPELVSSVEGTKTIIKYKKDRKVVLKDKRSEKLDIKKLPRLSTNMSDAFKYLMMRKKWRDLVAVKSTGDGSGADAAVEQWLEDKFK